MHARIVPFLAATALLFAGATALAENTINIQSGGGSQIKIDASAASNSVIDIYQVGTGLENQAGNASPINQVGGNHTARIGQGASYANGVWTPGSEISNNSATISQRGVNGDNAAIYQSTSSNTASISQSVSSQAATVTQRGSTLNSATVIQNGAAALEANIIQNGAAASTLIATQAATSAYTLDVTQGASGGHNASLETTSGYNGDGLTVRQTGSDNTANVTGMSGGSASIRQSGTSGYVAVVNQSSGALSIGQHGTGNMLIITNYGTGASSGQALSVTQTDSSSYIPDPPPSGPTYDPSPPP